MTGCPIRKSSDQRLLAPTRDVYKRQDKNIGILITDHNVQETLSLTDRAYLLFEGKILFQGTPEELSENQIAVSYTHLLVCSYQSFFRSHDKINMFSHVSFETQISVSNNTCLLYTSAC